MDLTFMADTMVQLLRGVPLTLQLAVVSLLIGAVIAVSLAVMRTSSIPLLDWVARAYIFAFRGSPLLVQLFLIYYGLGQFAAIRNSFLWVFLREPYWCALLALALNTGAYGAEIVRGGLRSVPFGAVEAARACGMSRLLSFRRIVLPLAIRQALPAYTSEMILMVKATSLASIVTLMEVTGIANKLISQTFRAIEVFVCAGLIYLAINFLITRALLLLEHRLSPHLRPAKNGRTAAIPKPA